MATINLSGYIEDGKVKTVIAGPTLLSLATGAIVRRLADTGTGGGGDSGDSGDSESSTAVSKESWS